MNVFLEIWIKIYFKFYGNIWKLLNHFSFLVSYFEYLKNINHVSFGKLTKHRDKEVITHILKSIQDSLKQANIDVSSVEFHPFSLTYLTEQFF